MNKELKHTINWLLSILLMLSFILVLAVAVVIAPFYAIGDIISAIVPKIKRKIGQLIDADN